MLLIHFQKLGWSLWSMETTVYYYFRKFGDLPVWQITEISKSEMSSGCESQAKPEPQILPNKKFLHLYDICC